jgi:hypothetical protein
VLGLPWLDDEHAFLHFGTTRVFTLHNGTALETQIEERRPECILMTYGKIQKLIRKTRRNKERNPEFYEILISPAAEQPAECHIGEELTAKQRENSRSLLYTDFPELLQPMDSPLVFKPTVGSSHRHNWPMKRPRLNILSHAKRAELKRQLKDAMDARLIRPNHNEFDSPILFVREAGGSLRLCIDYRGLTSLRVRTLTHFRVWMTPSMNSRTRIFTLILTSRLVLANSGA